MNWDGADWRNEGSVDSSFTGLRPIGELVVTAAQIQKWAQDSGFSKVNDPGGGHVT